MSNLSARQIQVAMNRRAVEPPKILDEDKMAQIISAYLRKKNGFATNDSRSSFRQSYPHTGPTPQSLKTPARNQGHYTSISNLNIND